MDINYQMRHMNTLPNKNTSSNRNLNLSLGLKGSKKHKDKKYYTLEDCGLQANSNNVFFKRFTNAIVRRGNKGKKSCDYKKNHSMFEGKYHQPDSDYTYINYSIDFEHEPGLYDIGLERENDEFGSYADCVLNTCPNNKRDNLTISKYDTINEDDRKSNNEMKNGIKQRMKEEKNNYPKKTIYVPSIKINRNKSKEKEMPTKVYDFNNYYDKIKQKKNSKEEEIILRKSSNLNKENIKVKKFNENESNFNINENYSLNSNDNYFENGGINKKIKSEINEYDYNEKNYSKNNYNQNEAKSIAEQYENKISILLSQMKIMSEKQVNLLDIISTLQKNSNEQINALNQRIEELENKLSKCSKENKPLSSFSCSSFNNLGSINEQIKLSLLYSNENDFFDCISSLNLNQIKNLPQNLKEDILQRVCNICGKGKFIHQSISFFKGLLICNQNDIQINENILLNIKDVLEYLMENASDSNRNEEYLKGRYISNTKLYSSKINNYNDIDLDSPNSINEFMISEEDIIDISLLLSFLNKN